MALDGIVIANIRTELTGHLTDARIYKISQPENDELLLTIKAAGGQYRLLLSANASLPLVYLTENNKPGPAAAPNFCMLLRKHIQNGRIISISQPGLERILDMEIEHRNELGDLCRKHLIVEIMGKHSNIIFCNESLQIIDSIKHVSSQMSSVREVLPGRTYFIPDTMQKLNPLSAEKPAFSEAVFTKPLPICKALYQSLTGISPLIAQEICHLSGIDSELPANVLSENEQLHLYNTFHYLMEDVRESRFSPNIVYNLSEPVEFSSILLSQYADMRAVSFDSISALLESYYAEKSLFTRIRQKSSDLRRIVQTALERSSKKYDLQQKQLNDTKKRDKYKVYGELIHAYGYDVAPQASSFEAINYYTNELITIPLDKQLTPAENAKKYFEKYNKLKRTFDALNELILETHNEITYLESVATSLDIAESEEDLQQIKVELAEAGYIRKSAALTKLRLKSRPFHYVSSDGYDIYVGKNNSQNDELTFKFASGNDWWFHAKGIPGSHVLVKSKGDELPDRTFEEAARLAAHYSKARCTQKVEIDYTQKKNVKKPGGAKPGFVVYYTNFSMVIDSNIQGIATGE